MANTRNKVEVELKLDLLLIINSILTNFQNEKGTNYTHRICNLAEIDCYYRMETKYLLSNMCFLKHLTVQSGIHED